MKYEIILAFASILLFSGIGCQNFNQPTFDNSTSLSDLSGQLYTAFNALVLPYYITNNCYDPRIPTYNLLNFTFPSDYQNLCIAAANDFGQVFWPYQCVDWYCSFQGTCSSSIVSGTSVAKPTCACNSGFSGDFCNLPSIQFSIANSWLTQIQSYLTHNYPAGTSLSGWTTFKELLNITSSLLAFTANNNVGQSQSVVQQLEQLILNVNNVNSQFKINYVANFANNALFLWQLNGFDPINILSQFLGNATVSNSNFGMASINSSNTHNVILQLNGTGTSSGVSTPSSGFLVDVGGNGYTVGSNINTNSPVVTIPTQVSQSLQSNTYFQLISVYLSQPYITVGGKFINSQVVSVQAQTTSTGANQGYTSSTPIQIAVPWTYTPFNVNGACHVYAYSNSQWSTSLTCTISSVDTNNAYVNCKEFSTIGVYCANATVIPVTRSWRL
jgi:hypothetical protein